MESYKIKSSSFLLPFVLGLISGYIQHNRPDWIGAWLTGYFVCYALVCWMFFYTWMTEKPNKDSWEAHKMEEYRKLSPEEKSELGYKRVSNRIDVVHHYKDNRGFEPRTSFDWIPWSAGRLQEFILATLRGVPPNFSQWEGPGRLFPDGEFERGMNKFLEPGIAYFAKKGTASNSPREITDAGLLAFVEYVEDLGLPYEIKPEYQERVIKMKGEE